MDGATYTTWRSGDGLAALHVGHVLDVLRSLPADHFHCMVTSPPYWGLRDYGLPPSVWGDGWLGCYGLEPTIDQFIGHTVEVFAEIRRVLRPDGVAWLNIGDSYNAYNFNRGPSPGLSAVADVARPDARREDGEAEGTNRERGGTGPEGNGCGAEGAQRRGRGVEIEDSSRRTSVLERGLSAPGLKAGDQCLIPHRVALALQADGWFVRSTVVWAKRSPMPESINGWRWERCRVKTANGATERWPDIGSQGARKEGTHFLSPGATATWDDCPGCDKCRDSDGYVLRKGRWRCTNSWEPIFQLAKSLEYFCDAEGVKEPAAGGTPGNKTHKGAEAYVNGDDRHRTKVGLAQMVASETRNPRNVWAISSEPLKAKHFAAFPSTIPRRCIEASTSEAGCCPACGSQLAPIVVKERIPTRPALNPKDADGWKHDSADGIAQRSDLSPSRDPQRHIQRSRVLGYRPTCGCGPHEAVPCRVLEPFAGSGTTLMVARWLGRESVGIELSETYAREIAQARIETPKPVEKRAKVKRRRNKQRERLLF